jgi:hypothetical protein
MLFSFVVMHSSMHCVLRTRLQVEGLKASDSISPGPPNQEPFVVRPPQSTLPSLETTQTY